MTSLDSGIETSNETSNSDDNSVAQNEDETTEKMNNIRSALARMAKIRNDIDKIKFNTFHIKTERLNICSSISPLGSINENFRYSDTESSIPTSSSGPSRLVFKYPGFKSRRRVLRMDSYNCYRKKKSVDITSRNHNHCISLLNIHAHFNERRMRIAAATNNTMMMRKLLNCGVSPNNCDVQGRTPLHLASCRGYTEMVRLLLEYGADPNLRDCVGNTPLHLAAVTSKVPVITLLLNAGIDPLCLDQAGCNPLQLAQTKLSLLQRFTREDMVKIKEELQSTVSMLLAYLQKLKDADGKIEALSTFCSRLSVSRTSNDVQDDVKDLLAKLGTLSITQ